jgi:F0F1-type ATP synthase membrane subunit c/vacuolar-type H+-ATPase subunit K
MWTKEACDQCYVEAFEKVAKEKRKKPIVGTPIGTGLLGGAAGAAIGKHVAHSSKAMRAMKHRRQGLKMIAKHPARRELAEMLPKKTMSHAKYLKLLNRGKGLGALAGIGAGVGGGLAIRRLLQKRKKDRD